MAWRPCEHAENTEQVAASDQLTLRSSWRVRKALNFLAMKTFGVLITFLVTASICVAPLLFICGVFDYLVFSEQDISFVDYHNLPANHFRAFIYVTISAGIGLGLAANLAEAILVKSGFITHTEWIEKYSGIDRIKRDSASK
jgi:hypothetical protein